MLLLLVILCVFFVLATILTEVEHFGFATLTLIATLVGVQLLHLADVLQFVMHHTVETLLYTVGYLVVGVAWSFIKWFSFLMRFRDKYRECRDTFLKDNNLKPGEPLADNMSLALTQYLSRQDYYGEFRGNLLTAKPRAAKNKSRIVSWMYLWPFSVIGTLLNDPVKRLFKFLFNSLKELYQKMADRVFANDPELK
jgi:hypothetical protein